MMKLNRGGKRVAYTKPLDGGWGWVVIICCFFNMLMIVGLVNGLGICLSNWKEDLNTSTSVAAGVGSSLPAIILLTNLLASNLSRRYGERIVMFFGGFIGSCGFISASFSTHIFHLYITISLLGGVGYGLVFQPTVVMPACYFKKRYGLANGFMFSGVGAGMIILPSLLRILIDEYTWRGSFLILGGISLNICVVACLMRPILMEEQDKEHDDETKDLHQNEDDYDDDVGAVAETSLSVTCTEQEVKAHDKKTGCDVLLIKYFKLSALWYMFSDHRRTLIVAVMGFLGLGNYPVLAHLPYRAIMSGISEVKAALLMSILGVGSLISRILQGWITDKKYMTIRNLFISSLMVCGISCMLSTVSDSFAWLLIFAIIFGLASGIFSPIFVPYVHELVGNKKLSAALGVVFPVLGLTSTFGGIFTGWLYDYSGNYDLSFYFAGGSLILSSLFLCMDPLLVRHKHRQNVVKMKKLDNVEC